MDFLDMMQHFDAVIFRSGPILEQRVDYNRFPRFVEKYDFLFAEGFFHPEDVGGGIEFVLFDDVRAREFAMALKDCFQEAGLESCKVVHHGCESRDVD